MIKIVSKGQADRQTKKGKGVIVISKYSQTNEKWSINVLQLYT